MLSLFDTPSLERALTLPLDRKLRHLLADRIEHINGLEFDVRELTYYLVVPAGCPLSDVADELGWSPVINPLDGSAYGDDWYEPHYDLIVDRGGWFELIVSAGNDAAFVILVQDDERTDPKLLGLCRAYAS